MINLHWDSTFILNFLHWFDGTWTGFQNGNKPVQLKSRRDLSIIRCLPDTKWLNSKIYLSNTFVHVFTVRKHWSNTLGNGHTKKRFKYLTEHTLVLFSLSTFTNRILLRFSLTRFIGQIVVKKQWVFVSWRHLQQEEWARENGGLCNALTNDVSSVDTS